MAFAIFSDDGRSFRIGQIPNPLLRLEMKLHPIALVLRIEQAEGMATESMHVAVGGRNAAIAHDDGDLMEGFRQ